ncbi:MAG: hypothetical protein FD189_1088 [Elusimicrobia bacterium]|nr:MAG: hypothetical protein FD189_1088 [Elusimicrobiota bacterium]
MIVELWELCQDGEVKVVLGDRGRALKLLAFYQGEFPGVWTLRAVEIARKG